MTEPKVLSKQRVWINSAGKEVPPPTEGIPILGWGGTNQDAQLHEITYYENGQIWSRGSADGGKTWEEPIYMETDPQLATQFRSDQSKDDSGKKTVNVEGRGQVVIDPSTLQPGQVAPGTEPPVGKPPEPTVSTSAKQIPVWDERAKAWGWKDNPNYVAPTPAQGPAFSGTAAGMDYASGLRMKEEAAASQLKMDEWDRQQQTLRDQLFDDIRLGIKLLPQGLAELEQWTAMNIADYQDHAKRVYDAEEYNRKLPQLQAQEDRAARADQREGNAQKVSALESQGKQGMSTVNEFVNSGVNPGRDILRMAYDPMQRIQAILAEKPAQGPQLQPQQAPGPFVPRAAPTLTVPPGLAPAAPTVTAPYGGDANAQANYEGMYPASAGNDPEAIWRRDDAARRAPTLR